jgi:hypothetical protein
MTRIVWDEIGERIFETGIDRGVLYGTKLVWVSNDGPPVLTESNEGFPWNGLISVDVKSSNASSTAMYFDGMKSHILVEPGDFSATIKAYTFPDRLNDFVGISEVNDGLFLDNQPVVPFDLCYRTLIGDDINGENRGYKIHILYNLVATIDPTSYQTVGSNIDPVVFSWTVESIPPDISFHRPTSHVIIDSTKISPDFLEYIEALVYGSPGIPPTLPPIGDLLGDAHFNFIITNNGDGTWTATGDDHLFTFFDDDGGYPKQFTIDPIEVQILSEDLFRVSSQNTPPVS